MQISRVSPQLHPIKISAIYWRFRQFSVSLPRRTRGKAISQHRRNWMCVKFGVVNDEREEDDYLARKKMRASGKRAGSPRFSCQCEGVIGGWISRPKVEKRCHHIKKLHVMMISFWGINTQNAQKQEKAAITYCHLNNSLNPRFSAFQFEQVPCAQLHKPVFSFCFTFTGVHSKNINRRSVVSSVTSLPGVSRPIKNGSITPKIRSSSRSNGPLKEQMANSKTALMQIIF